jgi:hypothetical protein
LPLPHWSSDLLPRVRPRPTLAAAVTVRRVRFAATARFATADRDAVPSGTSAVTAIATAAYREGFITLALAITIAVAGRASASPSASRETEAAASAMTAGPHTFGVAAVSTGVAGGNGGTGAKAGVSSAIGKVSIHDCPTRPAVCDQAHRCHDGRGGAAGGGAICSQGRARRIRQRGPSACSRGNR